ncbi:MAG: AAA family ATPase [Deltaproteobacteria bacterium]|jgi:chromosome segregation protein|nr:AAA family ATPase [Deltaproteobacteria bacterium]
MMYLKRVEIAGFKSFTERTVVPFGAGISAVVGPNGCGKSNIIDAIRWVMGEQSPKMLRARNMEDLLFSGSKGKNASALAEVVLTLARETGRGPAEISVTRRLYRQGDSEYLINRSQARLKDVMRFFIEMGMGTRSYAIIEQERVGRLVDARPEERRLLLDEAAGITRYKEQRKESEKKIDSASRNLETVALVMAENSKRLAQVARQAAKAARSKSIRDELKGLELALASRGFLEHGERRGKLDAERGEALELARSLIARASELELEAEGLKLEDGRADLLLEDGLGAFHGLDGRHSKALTELGHLRESLKDASERREAALKELAGQDGERETLQRDAARLEAESAGMEGEAEGLSARAKGAGEELAEARRAFEQADIAARASARSLDGMKDSLARAGEGLAGAESLAEHLAGRRRSLELEQNEMEHTLSAASDKAVSRARFKKGLEDDLAALDGETGALREAAASSRKAYEAARAECGRADSKAAGLKARLETLESLEASFSWHPHEIGDLLGRPELKGCGIVGPVAESVKIPPGGEEAAEACLGARLSWVLVRDRRAAAKALAAARRNRLGVYGFVIESELDGLPLAEALLGGKIELADAPGAPEGGGEGGGPPGYSGAQPGSSADSPGPSSAQPPPPVANPGPSGAEPGPSPPPSGPGSAGEGLADPLEMLAETLEDGTVLLARDGSFVSRRVLAGGARREGGKGSGGGKGLLARLREKEEAAGALASARSEQEALDARASEAREASEAAEGAMASKIAQKNALMADVSKADGRLVEAVAEEKGLKIRAGSLNTERERVERDIAAASEKRERFLKEKGLLEARLSEMAGELEALRLRSREASEALGELQERESAARRAADSAAEKLEGARRELKGVLNFLGNLDSRRKSLEAEADRQGAQAEGLSAKINELEAESGGLPEKIEEAREKLKGLRGEKDAIRARLAAKEDELRAARKNREEGQETLNALEKELLEADYRLARIKDNLLRDWHAEFRIPGEDPEEPEDPKKPEGQEEPEGQGVREDPEDTEGPEGQGVRGDPEGPEGQGVREDPEGPANPVPPTDPEGLGNPVEPENSEGPGDLTELAGTEALGDPAGPAPGPEAADGAGGSETPGVAARKADAPAAPGPEAGQEETLAVRSVEGLEYSRNPDSDVSPPAPGRIPAAASPGPDANPDASPGPDATSDASPGPEAAAASAPPAPPGPSVPAVKPPEILDPRDFAELPVPADAESRARKLRERLGQIGEVNLEAIDEERELKQKVGRLESQYLDLQKAIGDLKEGIDRINAVCRKRFTDTFQNASQKFQEIFPVLFEGGEGWLKLVEGLDPLDAGVEIRVHPPGKKITVMSLLSGGEKALTALALIFALYLIKPSPFCLLDEADAPLDEANIDRFNKLLRRLSESSQIIMVTHNKRTMQISDTLYGVTMETPGVSRLVSVSMSQAEALTR